MEFNNVNIALEQSITKEEISLLEVEEFTGQIITIQSLDEAEKAINYLSCHQVVGFDTETRPTYKKGQVNSVSLIQLSTDKICFLFRLNIIGFSKSLINFLSNPSIIKVGLSLKDDFMSMNRRQKITPQGFKDLQLIVPNYGIKDISLQKVYAILFHRKISKSQRLTNWEAEELTESQKKYAALDAWACLKIFNELAIKNMNLDIGNEKNIR